MEGYLRRLKDDKNDLDYNKQIGDMYGAGTMTTAFANAAAEGAAPGGGGGGGGGGGDTRGDRRGGGGVAAAEGARGRAQGGGAQSSQTLLYLSKLIHHVDHLRPPS